MTLAKKAYYEFNEECDKYYEGVVDPITGYVEELEEINKEMLNILTEISDIYNLKFLLEPIIEKANDLLHKDK